MINQTVTETRFTAMDVHQLLRMQLQEATAPEGPHYVHHSALKANLTFAVEVTLCRLRGQLQDLIDFAETTGEPLCNGSHADLDLMLVEAVLHLLQQLPEDR